MHLLRILLLALCYHLPLTASVTDDQMPIIAYMGVPDWHTSDEDFRLLSECGFTISLYPYASLDLMLKACRCAENQGVRIIGRCPEMSTSTFTTASTLRKEKGFFGYFIQDEPSVPELRSCQREMEQLRRVDSTHCFYLNLLPCYETTPEWINSLTKVMAYPDYLREASNTHSQQLSFDFYPITTDGIRRTWYNNLEMVRRESLASGKPFWGFVLSVPHAVYPQPTMGALRLQVYSNLAYGAQAIQYFTYWNPGKDEGYDYHDAPISREGKKTKTYALVQKMNKELKPVASLFHHASITSVNHLGFIPEGATMLSVMPTNIKSLRAIGKHGAIISQFEKDSHSYLAIVNKDYQNSMRVYIRPMNNTPRYLTKDLHERAIGTFYKVQPGDILLFMLK